MDKNIIKGYLTKTFIAEAEATPAIKLAGKIGKENKKINAASVKEVGKDMKGYEASSKKPDSDAKSMAQNKFNYNTDKEKDYHEQMEIMNGQEMIQYDRKPNDEYTDRALEAIEGSSRMGNNPEWANVVAKGQGGDPEFGKNLVKKIKASQKKRNQQTPTTKMYGDDWEVVKDTDGKDYAFESKKKENVLTEGKLGKGYTHFLVYVPNGKIVDGWDYKGLDLDEIKDWVKQDMKDNDYYGHGKKDFKLFNKAALIKKGVDVSDVKNWYTERFNEPATPAEPQSGAIAEEIKNNKPQIKESMKRLKFKKEFNGVGNALKLIPEAYKVDKTVFEMTDGNENYRIRWEGTVNEGKAEVLRASDKTLVNENIEKMKHLFNYKSENTLGLVKGKARVNENDFFNEMRAKLLTETEEIEGQDAEKEAPFEEAGIKQAADAKKHIKTSVSKDKGTKAPAPKKAGDLDDAVDSAPESKEHIEGSVSTDKGTKAPTPKSGKWEEISVPQAADAKKHITMNEEEDLSSDDEDGEEDVPKKKRADAYDASLDVDTPDDKADSLSSKDIEMGSKPEKFINKDLDASDDDEEDDVPAQAPAPAGPEAKLVRSKSSGNYAIMMKVNGKTQIIDMPEKYLDMYKQRGAQAVISQIKSDKRAPVPDAALMEELNKIVKKKKK